MALAMDAFEEFSLSTGLMVNPSKYSVYFGSVDTNTKVAIRNLTKYQEGTLPFRYLGILLTNKKLSISRIRHWSSKLLSFAGRLQLVKSVLFATTTYWMQCLPLPKKILHRIETVCRSFLWSGSDNITRKSPVAWSTVCRPKRVGGLSLISLKE